METQRVKLQLKFTFQTTPKDLFLAITKPQYLQNWIAEKVDFNESTGVFTFHWGDYSESAKIEHIVQDQFVKWSWVEGDRSNNEYVSFRIEEVDGDEYLDLYIEDFCDAQEEKDLTSGWDAQMTRLNTLVH